MEAKKPRVVKGIPTRGFAVHDAPVLVVTARTAQYLVALELQGMPPRTKPSLLDMKLAEEGEKLAGTAPKPACTAEVVLVVAAVVVEFAAEVVVLEAAVEAVALVVDPVFRSWL